jgi:hypothetical protein
MVPSDMICLLSNYPDEPQNHDLKPVPPQRWHFTFLSPSLIRPLPSQLLHFAFFLPIFCI